METTKDLSIQGYRYKAAERYERRRTDKEELTGASTAAMERR
jgi:hypothetical protein